MSRDAYVLLKKAIEDGRISHGSAKRTVVVCGRCKGTRRVGNIVCWTCRGRGRLLSEANRDD